MQSAEKIVPTNMNRIHLFLTANSLLIIAASLNRLTDWATGYVSSNQFLRWVDFNNMLIFPLIAALIFWLLKDVLDRGSQSRWRVPLNLLFLTAIYLLAASYGNHEITNYLHSRFCMDDPSSDLCRIIIFNDDEFSHYVFFIGFTLLNVVMMLFQVVSPFDEVVTGGDLVGLVGNGLFVALGIFANLAFEEIGFDLLIVIAVMVVAVGLFLRFGRIPPTARATNRSSFTTQQPIHSAWCLRWCGVCFEPHLHFAQYRLRLSDALQPHPDKFAGVIQLRIS